MADKNVRLKDDNGNHLFPQTKSLNIITSSGNLSSDLDLIMKQLLFYHASGMQNFSTTIAGEWSESKNHSFPLDWNCGIWDNSGIQVCFGSWSEN